MATKFGSGIGIIYKATNKMNGKCYVGLTTGLLKERMMAHFRSSIDTTNKRGYGSKFYRAIRKYGFDAFEWKVVLICPIEDLRMQEIITIEEVDSYYHGYNSTPGGEDNPMNHREFRDKVAKSKVGKKRPDMVEKGKLRAGTHASEETKMKMSLSHAGEKGSLAKLTRDKVYDIREKYATGEYFYKDLARQYGVSIHTIFAIIKRKTWKE
jgi:group I intron endonuclease